MVRSRCGWVVAGLLAGFTGLQLCFGAPVQRLTQQQVDAMAARDFQSLGPQYGDRNLHHSTIRFQDGARGYDTWISPELPARDARFNSVANQELHGWYCRSEAVALATDLASTSYLSSDKSFILTGTDFLVDDVLKPAPGLTVNHVITAVRPGGQVRDQGEWLRTGFGRPDYQPGHEYLLFLTLDRARNPSVFLAASWTTFMVSGNQVRGSGSLAAIAGIPEGQDYTVVRGRLDTLVAAFPCGAG